MIEMVSLSWLVLELTDSPSKVAFVGIARMLPMAILGLVAGTISDRISKMRILKYVQSVNTLVALFILILIHLDVISYWHAYISIFITGCGWVLDFTARRALYPNLFSGHLLINAISLDTASLTGSMMVGSILGGVAITLGGFSAAYTIITVMYLIALLLIVNISKYHTENTPYDKSKLLETIKEYIETIKSNRTIRATFLVTVVLNFFGFPYMLMVPVIARDFLGVEEFLFGLLLSAAGMGALLGSLVIASINVNRKGLVYVFGSVLMLFALFLFSISTSYTTSLLLLFLAGIGTSGFGTMQVIIALSSVKPHLRGRAMGAIALGIGSSPLGMLLVGYLAELFGAPSALAMLTSTGVIIMSCLWAFLPDLRTNSI